MFDFYLLQIFDSNVGVEKAFRFKIGKGKVIKVSIIN